MYTNLFPANLLRKDQIFIIRNTPRVTQIRGVQVLSV